MTADKDKLPPSWKMPSRRKQMRNLGRTIRDIANDPRLVSELTKQGRLEICRSCEFYVGARCAKCGCHLVAKAKFRSSKCPIGKW